LSLGIISAFIDRVLPWSICRDNRQNHGFLFRVQSNGKNTVSREVLCWYNPAFSVLPFRTLYRSAKLAFSSTACWY